MPSIPELVYAALLYKDGDSPATPSSTDFVQGTKAAGNDNLIFSFQRPEPEDTSGTFTLEVFAFVKADDGTANFSRSGAPFSKAKAGLTITGDAIDVGDIALEVNALPGLTGTVSLQIKVPAGCSLEIKELKADGTTESEPHFAITGTAPEFTITQNGTGISAGTYSVNFTVKKSGVTVHIFTESINVLPRLCTDTWGGLAKGAAKDIAQSMSTTLYVRGAGGWYDSTSPYNEGETAKADDANLGSFSSPLATIQKAIDKVIAMNDGSNYTIYIDGTLKYDEGTYVGTNGMADFSAPTTQDLNLTIRALSGTATLDAKQNSRVIYAATASGTLNLTLEKLVITNGNTAGNGGGVYIDSGALTMEGGTVTGNTASNDGGGVYVGGGTFTMSGGSFSGNTAQNGQGKGAFINPGCTFNMSGAARFDEDNDIYLSDSGENFATITVTGDLTADSPVATIKPSSYAAERQILSKGTKVTAITQDICDKFALSPNPAGGIWQIVPDGTGANGVLTRPDTIYLNSSSGDDTNSGLTASKAVQTLAKAIELYDTYNAEKIMVCAAYTLPSEESGLLDRAGKTKVTLMRYDGSSDVSDALTGNTVETGSMLLIYQGDVTISNVMLDGNKENVSASGSLLYIDGSDTIVTLGDDATLCNNKTSRNGGGVYVYYKSTFKMTGGAITGNETDKWGGGVFMMGYYATFEMSGGEISDNHAPTYSGGGVLVYGLFNMSGGTIRNNTSKYAGGVMINGADVRDFNMTGGKIINNTATLYGGGVCAASKFTMSGGEITGNEAPSGAGVYVKKEAIDKFTITNRDAVHDNTPDDIYEEPSS